MNNFTPTVEQDRVLQDIKHWLANPGPQWRYLAGFAGSGKTSLAARLAQDYNVAFVAFTGRAAQVLIEKGCPNATTLHKRIYRPEEKKTGETVFSVREDALDGVDLVVLDECSMITSTMAQDLLSLGKRVLATGDPFQLPPVSSEGGYFTSKEPHWFLSEVHRQAKESGILRLATDIREDNPMADYYGPECQIITQEEASKIENELLDWPDMIVVGTHRLRHHFNRQYRERSGFFDVRPKQGDQLVCLQNDHQRGLLNGQIWRCLKSRNVNADCVNLHLKSADSDLEVRVDTWDHDFTGRESKLNAMTWRKRSKYARFAYGYALTCHKAQGGGWDRVIVIDESRVFGDDASRWLYSAVTRAAKGLVLVRQ